MSEAMRKKIAFMQHRDADYYARASAGYDCTTGERDKGVLQKFAARKSQDTRQALFSLVGDE